MLVHRRLEIERERGPTPASLVRHVHEVLGEDVERRIWFFVPDRAGYLQRLLAVAPALAPLVREARPTLVSSFTDFDGVTPPPVAIDAATLERSVDTLSTEIPHSHAFVHWGPVPALRRTDASYAPTRTGEFPLAWAYGAEVMMELHGDRLGLQAGVLDDAPPLDATELPPLPSVVAALGPSWPLALSLYGSPDEIAAARALDAELAPAERALAERVRTGASTASYPHALADDPFVPGMLGSFDALLDPKLAALGYRRARRLSLGAYRFTRRTARDNQLVIDVARSAQSGEAGAEISLRGPLWSSPVYLPLAPDAENITIWTDDTMRRVADNVAFAAQRIEEELLAVVEPARPRGCAWYARGAT